MWKNVPAGEYFGLGMAGDSDSGDYGPTYYELERDYIDKNGYILHRDGVTPYLYNEENGDFISFDDCLSVSAKADFAKKTGLGGLMYWEHSCDTEKTLIRALGLRINAVKR